MYNSLFSVVVAAVFHTKSKVKSKKKKKKGKLPTTHVSTRRGVTNTIRKENSRRAVWRPAGLVCNFPHHPADSCRLVGKSLLFFLYFYSHREHVVRKYPTIPTPGGNNAENRQF